MICTTSMGLGFSQPEGFFEYAERAVLISFTDQGPLLGQGIPSVQLSAWGDEPELTREAYHSPRDVYELVTPQAIEAYGRVAECTIRSLEAMPSLPQEGSKYLLVEEDRVIGQPLLLAAQLVLLMPLYLHFGLSAKSIGREGWREVACYAATLGALAASYGLSKLLPLFGLIPYYELYPPPPRHPLLYQPDYAAMALWAGPSAAALYLSLMASRRLGPGHDAARACELAILSVLSLAALSLNPFGATLLLLPAAYLWPYVRPGRGSAGKALSGLLVLLGGRHRVPIDIRLCSQDIPHHPPDALVPLHGGGLWPLYPRKHAPVHGRSGRGPSPAHNSPIPIASGGAEPSRGGPPFYFDASAIVKRCHKEVGSEALDKIFELKRKAFIISF